MTARARPARPLLAAMVAVLATSLTACASSSGGVAARIHQYLETPSSTTTTAPTPPTTVLPCDPTQSEPPSGALPSPGVMPAGTYMQVIQQRGHLIVGVDQNTEFFGYRDPQTGVIDGFDIALAREVARAIFGNPNAIELRAVTTDQRLPAVESGQVDMVASQVTATCARRQQVDLSTIYYLDHQKLLVRAGSPITGVAGLAGDKVCATSGSTSIVNIAHLAPGAVLYPVAARTDCLVALEEGWVDAVTSDDTILLGLEVQDPYNTTILPAELSNEPYALATSKQFPEFGRFVNGVLEQLRTNGRLEQLYRQWLDHPDLGFAPPASPPAARYLPQ